MPPVDGRNVFIKRSDMPPHIPALGRSLYASRNVIGETLEIGTPADEEHLPDRSHAFAMLVAAGVPVAIVAQNLVGKRRGGAGNNLESTGLSSFVRKKPLFVFENFGFLRCHGETLYQCLRHPLASHRH